MSLLGSLNLMKEYKQLKQNLQEVLSRSSTSDLVVNWKCMRTWPLFRGFINNSSLKVSSLPFDVAKTVKKTIETQIRRHSMGADILKLVTNL